MLDIFTTDAFGVISLTASINRLPYVPSRLGSMGLFRKRGITSTVAVIEYANGRLSLIPAKARGTMPTVQGPKGRKVRSFPVPHLPLNDAVIADEVQGVRDFGSEDATMTVTGLVNDKLQSLRQSHELTHEWHRVGAIQGNILDADGVTSLFNLYTEFGLTQTTVNFPFLAAGADNAALNVQALATSITRTIEDRLGAGTYNHIHAFCGDQFFDRLVSHSSVRGAYEKWQANVNGQPFGIGAVPRTGFTFAGITWENYRGSVGGTRFVPTDEARFVPVGVPDLFFEWYAPADFIETVNTVGKPVYAKQETMKFDKGVELHTQSNPLMMCSQPDVLVRGLDTST